MRPDRSGSERRPAGVVVQYTRNTFGCSRAPAALSAACGLQFVPTLSDPRCRLRNPFRERQRSEAALPLRPQSLPPRGPLGETGGANSPRPASSTSRHRLRQVAIPDITTALEQVCALWRVFLTALGKPSVPYATSTSVLVKQSNTRTATAYAQQDNSRRVLSPTRTGPNLH